ncbi:MAG: hypothetical protein ACLQRH_00595 [Acidimicrobiales bacterium]
MPQTNCRAITDDNWVEVEHIALQLLASPDGRLDGADLIVPKNGCSPSSLGPQARVKKCC